MADDLQALLDKLTNEGVRKGEEQQAAIVKKAEADAAALVSDAKAQAAKIVSDAQAQADLLVKKGQEALRQSARDIMLGLRKELENRVRHAVLSLLKETLSGEALASVIAAVITEFMKSDGASDDLTVLLNPAQCAALEGAVKAKLAAELRSNCSFAPSAGLANGFKIVFSGSDVMYDFSDQALTEAMAGHVGPTISALLTEN